MHRVLVAGAGKIGSLIACLLSKSGSYTVHLADTHFKGSDVRRLLTLLPEMVTVVLDFSDVQSTQAYLKKHKITAIVSALPYFLNHAVAQAAQLASAHYFDLTEDRSVAESVRNIALNANCAFVPQCGLAPGFISIAAHGLMQEFESCEVVKLRVGALPQLTSNALHYALTWSTEGLINEYGNPCSAIEAGELVTLSPLEDLETIQIDGSVYEAFNTSGGLGGLELTYAGKVQSMNYKTLRYPGHCQKMHFLMHELRLNEDRPTLKRILERVIPKTYQDLVIIYVSVEGLLQGELTEKSYVKKIYPQVIETMLWSAIQVSTASSLCVVLDLVMEKRVEKKGLILQEEFKLSEVLANRFGLYFR